MKTLFYLVNDAAYFFSHRAALAQAAQRSGWTVHVSAHNSHGPEQDRFTDANMEHHDLGKNLGPSSVFRLFGAVKRGKPDLVHVVTLKCTVLWAFVAPFHRRLPTLHTIAGFGQLRKNEILYRALRFFVLGVLALLSRLTPAQFIVQNPGDAAWLSARRVIPAHKLHLVEGSGVDTDLFKPGLKKTPSEPLRVATAARRLKSKGLPLIAGLARQAREKGLPIRFVVASVPAGAHADAITEADWNAWRAEDLFEDRGHVTDMAAFYGEADAFLYLSEYGEGLAKTLLEAAASGLPILTTDHDGCRESVIEGVSGHLVDPRDNGGILERLMALQADPARRKAMGLAGRKHIETRLSDDVVIARMLSLYSEAAP